MRAEGLLLNDVEPFQVKKEGRFQPDAGKSFFGQFSYFVKGKVSSLPPLALPKPFLHLVELLPRLSCWGYHPLI